MNASLRTPLTTQLVFAGAAVLASFGSFVATATPAHAATGYYSAQLATPVEGTAKTVINDVAWKCDGDACGGNAGASRAEIACARLAHKYGEVASFTVKGEALDADGLAKCNGAKNEKVARR